MKKFKKIVTVILILSLFTFFVIPITSVAEEESGYTSVLEDLENTDDFDFSLFDQDGALAGNAGSYTLDIFQVAEGENGELFVYVYMPASDRPEIRARSISMGLHHYESKTPSYKSYNLTYIDSYKTLQKYVVDDFKVSEASTRYYNITTIYRENYVDLDNGGGIFKGFPVAKCFCAYNYRNTVKYEAFDIDVVDVDIKGLSTIRYFNYDVGLVESYYTDLHYVAFTIENYDAKKVYNATVSYSIGRDVNGFTIITGNEDLIDFEPVIKDISYNKKVNVDGYLWVDYTWDSIMSLDKFKEEIQNQIYTTVNFDEEINNADFVLLFEESDYIEHGDVETGMYTISLIREFKFLRLEFATPLGTYNLGVVSDAVDSEDKPSFEIGADDGLNKIVDDFKEGFSDLSKDLGTLTGIVMLVLGVAIIKAPFDLLKQKTNKTSKNKSNKKGKKK